MPIKQRVHSSLIHLEKLIDCPFGLALENAEKLFPLLESAEEGVRLPLRALRIPVPGALHHRVRTHFRRQIDSTEFGRPHEEFAFDWVVKSSILPDFEGVIRFRIAYPKTRIILHGQYSPPFGWFGQIFDRAIGHHIATATADDLLKRFANVLEKHWSDRQGQTDEQPGES